MNNGKRFLISIDGGGTNTGVCVYDCAHNIRFFDICGGGNYKVHGIDIVKERINECLHRLISDSEDIPDETRFLVFGSAGCDSPKDVKIYTDMITSLGFDKESILICNDSEMIFRALAEAPGICVIAGTGTIALSFDRDGMVRRAGGWGAPLSDEGSGYWIGAEILRLYLNWIDGTGPYIELFSEIEKIYPGQRIDEIAAEIGSLPTDKVAEWARFVFDRIAADRYCENIVLEAGQKAAALAGAVYRKSSLQDEEEFSIVESGSLFKNDLYEISFRKVLKEYLPDKKIHFIRSEGIPAEDGIKLAGKLAEKVCRTQSCD